MLLEVFNLKKEYKRNNLVLDDINLSFKSGEFVCIYGESGSGKSTFMNIIGGLDNCYSGDAFIDGENIRNISSSDYLRDKVGFIFQKYNLISSLSVIENVLIPLDICKVSKYEKINRAKSVLSKVGLLDKCNKRINELSGGEMQRVAIARALIKNPDIILADEPTGALDSKNSKIVLDILSEISKEGKIVIVVTHSNMVREYASRVITISDGKVVDDNIISERIIDYDSNTSKMKRISSSFCFKFGFKNIFKNFKRNLLLSFATSIGIIGIILSLFIGSGVKKYVEREIKNNFDPLSFNVYRSNSNELYDINYFSDDDLNKINNIKHINKIDKGISISNSYIFYDNNRYDLIDLSSFNEMKTDKLKYGNVCDNGIIISDYLANQINKNEKELIGKEIDLTIIDTSDNAFVLNKKVVITGIYKKGKIDLVNNSNYAYISYDFLRKIYSDENKKLMVTNLSINIDDKSNIKYVKNKLSNINYKLSSVSDYTKDIYKYLDIATVIITCFSSVSLIVSCIMIIIVFNINVIERTKEIGILKSLGLRRRDIKKIFKTESVLIGVLTSLISIIISFIISNNLDKFLYNNYKIYIINKDIKYMLFSSILCILVCLIGCIIPSSKASKLNTIDSLRYE